MRAAIVLAGLAVLLTPAAARGAAPVGPATGVVAPAGEIRDEDGVVFRYYAGYGYRFQPLLSFARLNLLVSMRRLGAARRLASALVARGVRRGGAVYWEYDFPFGGPAPWTSGFAQAVGAQALARTGELAVDVRFERAADAAFSGLRRTLLMRLGGGLWVREYGFTSMAILNAQLQSIIALESYAAIAESTVARRVAARMYRAARALLPSFQLGCWSRYSLLGAAATRSYHAYHVDLLRRLASRHARDRIWWRTYVRWIRCLGRPPAARRPAAPWRDVSAAYIRRPTRR